MVAQLGLHDKDLVLWTQLLAEVLNTEIVQRLKAEHPHVRHAHGFLIQQLVEAPRPVGEIAGNLGVTSQAVSKSVRELEALGYVDRWSDPADGRVRRVALTDKGRAMLEATRAARAAVNAELAEALGAQRAQDAAATLKAALEARGAMGLVQARRLPPPSMG